MPADQSNMGIISNFLGSRLAKKEAGAMSTTSARESVKKNNLYRERVFASDHSIREWKSAIQNAVSEPYRSKTLLYEICRQALFDGHLRAQINTRHNGTIAEPYTLTRSGLPVETETDKIKATWFEVIVKSILRAEAYWATAIEIELNKNGVEVYSIEPLYLHPETGKLLPDPTQSDKGIAFENFGNLLVFKNSEAELGYLAIAAQYTIYKRYSVSDWARHSELFGMPFLSLKTPVTDTTELLKRHDALSNFGRNAYAILDTDETLDALDPKTPANPHAIYAEMKNFCNEEISKVISGQTGTSEQKAYVGAAQVHERVLDWYVEADMRRVAAVMNYQVLPFLESKGIITGGLTFEWEYFREKAQAKAAQKNQAASAEATLNTLLNHNPFTGGCC